MSVSASGYRGMLPGRTAVSAAVRTFTAGWVESALSVAVFATMCFVVLSAAPQAAEPDDGAYQASIVAMADGHYLTLSESQAEALAWKLDDFPALIPTQWVELTDGRYISEKDPGYPFLATPFYAAGLIRWAPLFYGALACLGLFMGARRWLGSFGGLAAVGLYCSSGAALAFAWRDFMPTFTDASLIAAGSGALLWAMLAGEAGPRRRNWIGLGGFLALEAATFVRYTDIAMLGCAIVAVIVASLAGAAHLPRRTLCTWLASVAAFGAGVAVFDDLVYGGPLNSGYPPGQITFGLRALGPNLRMMPAHLMQAMPMLVLGLIALTWIVARWPRRHRMDGERGVIARCDLWVGLALGGSWFTIWSLYATYTGTTDPGNVAVQDVRLYLPALGIASLLGAWLVTRVPGRRWRAAATSAAVIGLFVLGVSSFHAMYSALGVPLGG